MEDIVKYLEELRSIGNERESIPARVTSAGKIWYKGKDFLNFTSWDFLNINNNPQFKKRIQQAIEEYGFSNGSSRFVSGTRDLHIDCEKRLASFLGHEKSVILSSKNQAVFSLISGLANEKTTIILDSNVQSPVVDAAYLVDAKVRTFNTSEADTLEAVLSEISSTQHVIVFFESLSGLYGKVASTNSIIEIAKRYGAKVIVDESFALGVCGSRGAGICELQKTSGKVDCIIADLSLAFQSFGVGIVASNDLIDFILNRSSTLRHEVSLPIPVLAASLAAFDIIELMLREREQLEWQAVLLEEALSSYSAFSGPESRSPILSLEFENVKIAREYAHALLENAYLVEVLGATQAKRKTCVIRLLINNAHSLDEYQKFLATCADINTRVLRAV